MGGWSEKTKVIPNSTQLKLKFELSLAIMSFIVATYVVASRPPERQQTGMPTARANI